MHVHNANSLQASFTAPATMGTYIFHFQATNVDFWAEASTKIHVQPIIVSAGSLKSVLHGDPVTLTGSYTRSKMKPSFQIALGTYEEYAPATI